MRLANYTAVFLIAVIVLSCGKNQEESIQKLTFWHFWSEPNQRKALDSLIAVYEKENEIEIEMVELSWNDGKTKLLAAFNSRTAPDVIELGSDWVAQFSSEKVLTELNENEMQIGKYISMAKEPSYWEGSLYAIPWIVNSRVMYINNDLLEIAGVSPGFIPNNYDELKSVAEEVNQLEGKFGFGANGSDAHRLYKKIIPMFWSFGGEIFDKNGKVVLNSPENLLALQTYLELSRVGLIESQRQIDAEFVKGNIGIWFSGTWLAEKIKKENQNLNYSVALVPHSKESEGISFAGGEYLSINAASENKEEAIKFVNWICSGENALKFCAKVPEAGFPADSSYYNAPELISTRIGATFANQLKKSRMTPVHPKWLDIEKIIEDMTANALYAKGEPSELLKKAQEDIKRLIK